MEDVHEDAPVVRTSRRPATGLWREPGVPHKGWDAVDFFDRGEADQQCEMCFIERVRYMHQLTHPAYPTPLWVGSVCAAHMCETYDALAVEKQMKSAAQKVKRTAASAERARAKAIERAARMATTMELRRTSLRHGWLSGWRTSQAGNSWRKMKGYVLCVFFRRRGESFGWWVKSPAGLKREGGWCATEEDAMLHLFDTAWPVGGSPVWEAK